MTKIRRFEKLWSRTTFECVSCDDGVRQNSLVLLFDCSGCSLTDEAVNDTVDHLLEYLHQDVRRALTIEWVNVREYLD